MTRTTGLTAYWRHPTANVTDAAGIVVVGRMTYCSGITVLKSRSLANLPSIATNSDPRCIAIIVS